MTVLQQLDQLQSSGLVRLSQGEPRLEYEIRHTLYRDTAYRSLLRGERRRLHEITGRVLERSFPAQLRELAPRLAEHSSQAGEHRQAVKYLQLAGAGAMRVHAYREAVAYFERALDLARGDEFQPLPLAANYRDLGRALELARDFEQVLVTYVEMRAGGSQLNSPEMELAAMTLEGTLYSTSSPLVDRAKGRELSLASLAKARELGDIEGEIRSRWNVPLTLGSEVGREGEALVHGAEALRLADQAGLLEMGAFLRNDLGRVNMFCRNLDAAESLLRQAETHWRRKQNLPMLVDCLTTISLLYQYRGDFVEIPSLSGEARKLADETGNPWARAYSLILLDNSYFETGQFGLALDSAHTALEMGRESEFIVGVAMSWSGLGRIYTELGNWDRALKCVDKTTESLGPQGHRFKDQAEGIRAKILLLQGRLDQVQETLKGIRTDAGSNGTCLPIATVPLLVAVIDVEIARGEVERALDRLAKLEQQVADHGLELYLPKLLELRGRAWIGRKKPERGAEALRRSLDLAQAMGATRVQWPILEALAEAERKRGRAEGSRSLLRQAEGVIDELAQSLQGKTELQESFLGRPKIRAIREALA